jgi:hypothetical protein
MVEPLFRGQGPGSRSDDFYPVRHWLSKSREGYTFPALVIESEIDQIRVSWTNQDLPAHKAELISEGSTYLSAARFQEALAAFIEKVVGRLDERGVTGTFLQDEWRAIQDADDEERAFCAAAGALGLDPYSLDDDLRGAIEDAGNTLPQALQNEFFAAVDVPSLVASAKQLGAALEMVRGTGAQLQPLIDLRIRARGRLWAVLQSDQAPWLSGYQAARLVRSELSLDGNPVASFDELGDHLGLDPSELDSSIVRAELPRSLDAAVSANALGSPGFALRSGLPDHARRYHFCRALLEFLAQGEPQTSLVSSAASYSQKVNRAFAAELLAPAAGISERLQRRAIVSFEDIDELAAHFGVAPLVIEHQIQNHNLAYIASALS